MTADHDEEDLSPEALAAMVGGAKEANSPSPREAEDDGRLDLAALSARSHAPPEDSSAGVGKPGGLTGSHAPSGDPPEASGGTPSPPSMESPVLPGSLAAQATLADGAVASDASSKGLWLAFLVAAAAVVGMVMWWRGAELRPGSNGAADARTEAVRDSSGPAVTPASAPDEVKNGGEGESPATPSPAAPAPEESTRGRTEPTLVDEDSAAASSGRGGAASGAPTSAVTAHKGAEHPPAPGSSEVGSKDPS
ncbi:MAG: hypothetical protein KC416_13550, partial [Myxococcales bacterium]|nr:hypothetical protein [Myxococcales bacterium]